MPSITAIEEYIGLIKTDASKTLGVKIGDKEITPGDYLPKLEAAATPTLSFAVSDTIAKHVVICVDLDGPFPSFNFLSPILHWIQSDLQTSSLTTNQPSIANYVGPGPPPGSGPHRYVFLLYKQPSEFRLDQYVPSGGKEFGIMARMRYDLSAFEEMARLGKPIAVNYFTSN
ncbi:hypothetical protein PV10_00772 [Exophiala mesophila]|uniref:Uncharacterized protein n=1 Tax=Exophiala mesophila TaxID=212818 RepID=A0A0D1ZQV9_EXOME|nr:uncharacterized protein PV10_00772 [Exophiala mesophila]KIV96962.1 hypothetical protein PV10_00772 [Exophiala mesophila]